MNESVDKFCDDFKAKFPGISKAVEKELESQWPGCDEEFYSYTWFEALANTLNKGMEKQVKVSEFSGIFEFIRVSYIAGSKDVKNTVDVAFVENLFWEITSLKIKPYWEFLPEVLKDLYINFYGQSPI